jgi:hypothetical protein
MEQSSPGELEAGDLRASIESMEMNQSGFADLLNELGDHREFKTVLRSIQRMVSADAKVSGEMHVIITLLRRDRARARRVAECAEWIENPNGGYSTIIQGVRVSVSPQSGGRWSIAARHIADGPDGYSPSFPHWRRTIEEAKIRAVMAVDETLDHLEEINAQTVHESGEPA